VVFFGSTGFEGAAACPDAIGPATYAVMLPYGDPAELTRLGCVLTWIKSANKRMWKTAAMPYIEPLCLGSPDVDR
jgi:hypothetical protein